MSLSACATDIVEMPGHSLSVELNIKDVFRDAHGLDAGV
jgi:hypothetical protein